MYFTFLCEISGIPVGEKSHYIETTIFIVSLVHIYIYIIYEYTRYHIQVYTKTVLKKANLMYYFYLGTYFLKSNNKIKKLKYLAKLMLFFND